MKWFRHKWLQRALSVGLVLVVIGALFAVRTARRSFPDTSGTLTVEGLNAEVTVTRDSLGVPTIVAANSHDLFFTQGYVHAQDRFWQMDFWRHIGAGRLSEMFGASQVDTDKFLRSLGFTSLAEQEIAAMNATDLAILESYAAGVNAYLASHDGSEISLEYAVLGLQNSGYEIEPWSPVNTLTWAKLMSWDLSGNMRNEIARTVLTSTLPLDQVEAIYPPYPADHPVIVPSDQVSGDVGHEPSIPIEAVAAIHNAGLGAKTVWDLTGGGFDGIGSNSWVVDGSRSTTGLPILANDPHLGIQLPSIWYANTLRCSGCEFQLAGFSFPGTPGIVIGHNDRIAWGVTTQATDTQDLFIERVNPANPSEYEVDGTFEPFQTRTETIVVAGGDDEMFEVRSSRHGPIISGTFLDEDDLDDGPLVDLPDDYVVALAWQTLEPSTLVEAILGMNRATNYDEFRTAVSQWDIAAQNIVYADVDGNIAYHSTGEIPIRLNSDGRYPVPGWTSEFDWQGTIPFDDMPYLFNPPRGYIETANQPVVVPGATPELGADGRYAYRAERIDALLASSPTLDVESMQQLQMDSYDGGAAQLVPYLVAAQTPNERVLELQARLEAWDFQATGDSNAAAIYQASWRHLLLNTFDELPDDYQADGGERWFETVHLLLTDPTNAWWDDAGTIETETRDDILVRSLLDADAEVSDLLGDNIDDWSWGQLHTASFENQTLGQSGIAPLEALFNRSAPERVGGGTSIVNANGWDTSVSYEVDWIPSMRMVIDMSDLTNSTFMHAPGQSGHAFHSNYADLLDMWAGGEQVSMPWDATEGDTLTLTPES